MASTKTWWSVWSAGALACLVAGIAVATLVFERVERWLLDVGDSPRELDLELVVERWPSGALRTLGQTYEDREDWPVVDRSEGCWTRFYENGAKETEGRYRRSARVGVWAFWYESGVPRSRGALEGGARVGPWTLWYENGARSAQGAFSEHRLELTGRDEELDGGKAIGIWRFWHPDGRLAACGAYLESAGERRAFVADFLFTRVRSAAEDDDAVPWTLFELPTFRGGLAQGAWHVWSADGALDAARSGWYERGERVRDLRPDERATCAQDDEDELVRETWPDGTLRAIGESVPDPSEGGGMSVRIGTWTSFHPSGAKASQGAYRDGTRAGVWTWWHESGVLAKQGDVDRGLAAGKWLAWTADGALDEERSGWYAADERVRPLRANERPSGY